MLTRAWLACWLMLAALIGGNVQAQPREPATVRIGVFTLFHPAVLILTASVPFQLDSRPYPLTEPVAIHATGDALAVVLGTQTIPARTLSLPVTTFTLAVPGKLTRTYRGALTITAHGVQLVPILVLDTELAVASIIAAEAPPHAPVEALKAQAIASRSYLLANLHAHPHYDACDTTHCQFLRSPPPVGSPALLATLATRHVVLTWQPQPGASPFIVSAMYSRSCGGRTHARPSANPTDYPFYGVRCDFCSRHPQRWTRVQEAPKNSTEQQRLAYNRTHGWSALPSSTYTTQDGKTEGVGTGHGIGLCQLGAADLASRGQPYTAILAHFFPNTHLSTLP